MGMFDEILCDMPLPDGYNAEGQVRLQTKALDASLDLLRITHDGRLIMEKQFRNEAAEPCQTDHTGAVRFYGIEGDINGDDDLWIWHEYEADFTDGQCREIRLVKPVTGAELHSERLQAQHARE